MHLEPLLKLSQIFAQWMVGMQGIPNFRASVSKAILVCSWDNNLSVDLERSPLLFVEINSSFI